jgi:hypothetical protein
VKQLGEPNVPVKQEANAELSLVGVGRPGTFAINVGVRPEKGPCFNVFFAHPHSGGQHFNMLTFPRTSASGRLAMRREGAEILFLAADGPEAPLSELARLPCWPDLKAVLRLSAYQGSGPNPQPVDVTFSNMTLRADQILRGPQARQISAAAPAEPRKYAHILDYSQKPGRILSDFSAGNDQSGAFQVDDGGIRVHPPVKSEYRKDAATFYFRDSRFALEGDFEISLHYRVRAMGPYGREGTGSVSFSVVLQNDTRIGTISLGRSGSRDMPGRYGITKEIPTRTGLHYDSQHLRTNANSGRMIIQRTGSEAVFLAQEGETPPRELSRVPFTSGPIGKVRLVAYQGSNCTNVLDVTFSDFVVKAERIIDGETNAPIAPIAAASPSTGGGEESVVLDSMPHQTSRKWLYLKIALLLLGVVILFVGAWLVMNNSKRKSA